MGLVPAMLYPSAKRSPLAQLVLGLAFSWSIPMAWAAVTGELAWSTGLLFMANAAWTVAYDTYYAMVDRDDDLRIGIKSTAILFGRHDLRIIALLQGFNAGVTASGWLDGGPAMAVLYRFAGGWGLVCPTELVGAESGSGSLLSGPSWPITGSVLIIFLGIVLSGLLAG